MGNVARAAACGISLSILAMLGGPACGLGAGGGEGAGDAAPSSPGGNHDAGAWSEAGLSDGASSGASEGGADTTSPSEASGPDGCSVCASAPAGWALVAFSASQHDKCPAGLTQSDVVESTLGSSACTCSCTPMTAPGCGMGTITQAFDQQPSGGTCQSTNPAFLTSGCVDPGWNLLDGHLELWPPTPTAGTCATTGMANMDQLTTTPERVCAPPADPCLACTSLPSSYQTCISTAGDVACASGFPTKHLVGTQPSITCSNTCACTLTATACTGNLVFYSDTMCSMMAGSFAADGNCHPANLDIQRYEWHPGAPQGVQCQATGNPTGTVSLTAPMTVCCP